MLRDIGELTGYAIEATDGPIGHVRDFYFDDVAWVVRYFVVDAGKWLASRKVLISPIGMGPPDDTKRGLPVLLTQRQVHDSPDLATDGPVSHEDEKRLMAFHGYPAYWGGMGLWGDGGMPNLMMPGMDPLTLMRLDGDARLLDADTAPHDVAVDHHLRSFATITTYRLHATDGEIGRVRGLLVDPASWAIRYLIVDTADWWLGRRVLVPPLWANSVDWLEETISVDLTRRQVKDAPPFEPDRPVDREQERALHRHYDRSGYWLDAPDLRPAVAGL